MAYTPTVWKNGEFPPIDAEHLNKIEQGIANSAPGGFGLGGGSKMLTPDDDLNNIWEDGWYTWDGALKNAPTVGGSLIPYCSMQVINKGSSYNMHQIARTFEGYEIRRYYDGATKTWSEWAWANPPMMAGVEYRTTEFYLGKPVYTKVVDCGNLPDGTTAEVAHGIANVGIVVGAQAIASNGTGGFNGLVYLPSIYNGSLTDRWTDYLAGVDAQNIRIFCGGGLAGCPVYVTLKYTKTTD